MKTIKTTPGTELLKVLKQANVKLESPCGGKGACGKCLIQITTGEVESDSLGLLTETAISQGYVLACKTKILTDSITVKPPPKIDNIDGQFLNPESNLFLIEKELVPQESQVKPATVKHFFNVSPPCLEDGLSDADRLTKEIRKSCRLKNVVYTISVLQKMADVLRQKDGSVTITVITSQEQNTIIDIEAGDRQSVHYGIAVDVGTTTISVQLVHLTEARIVKTQTAYNDQLICGLDVISRINYAHKPYQLIELRERVQHSINQLIQQLCEEYQIEQHSICSSVIAGNTTMIHLLLGLKPEYIRLAPYMPTVSEIPSLTAEKVGIEINPESLVYFCPHVGSYVGGDITSGILCTDLATSTEEISLFIDIGTNGELVIGNYDFLMTCACSAGPAFEGGGIEHGMRASKGAIEDVSIDYETGVATCQTIGDVHPMGICGSGMIALLANLFLTGWIDAAGKLKKDKQSPVIRLKGRRAEYIIVPQENSGTGKPITISEVDIENIMRAKAAIYSACSLMLDQVGLDFTNIAKIYIAGGFGRYLNIENAITIGLIPDLPLEIYQYIGNSSLVGAYMVLISEEYRHRQIELARKMTYIELNTDPQYMNEYMGAMFLPHTDENLFPSIRKKIINNNRVLQ